MSKYVKVSDGGYKIKIEDGSDIILDTTGDVVVTGNLLVSGDSSTINVENMAIEDNLIVINNGETGAGVTGPLNVQYGGITIDRGSLADSFWVFDETETWYDPVTATTQSGLWTSRYGNGVNIAIQTNSIDTGGGDLALISSGTGVITVTGTTDYENQVTDDDHVPNKKYVDDKIETEIANSLRDNIIENDTTIEVQDFQTTGSASRAIVVIDGTQVSEFAITNIDFFDVRITENQIFSTYTDDDLVLSANGAGTVKIDDVMSISKMTAPAADPNPALSETKIYVRDEDVGGTGIFFVNENQTRDELISNNRALLYGMIF